jgi:hypothetical protein
MDPKRADVESFWTRRSGWLSLAVAVLVSSVDLALDRFLVLEGLSRSYMLALSSIITGAVAGGVFLYVARHEKARRDLMRERVRTIAELNHHIRNALQVIKIAGSQPDSVRGVGPLQLIKESADRIEWALREVLPKYPTPENRATRQPPVGYAAVSSPRGMGAFAERRRVSR